MILQAGLILPFLLFPFPSLALSNDTPSQVTVNYGYFPIENELEIGSKDGEEPEDDRSVKLIVDLFRGSVAPEYISGQTCLDPYLPIPPILMVPITEGLRITGGIRWMISKANTQKLKESLQESAQANVTEEHLEEKLYAFSGSWVVGLYGQLTNLIGVGAEYERVFGTTLLTPGHNADLEGVFRSALQTKKGYSAYLRFTPSGTENWSDMDGKMYVDLFYKGNKAIGLGLGIFLPN